MKKTIFAALLLMAGIISCKKNQPGPSADAGRINSFFSKYSPKAESFTLNAGVSSTIVTSNGARLTFPANAIIDAGGNLVSGSVAVNVLAILKPSDMLLADKPTVDANGNFLVSSGEIIVKAENKGGQLGIRPNMVQVALPRRDTPGPLTNIPIWNGDTIFLSTLTGYNHFNKDTFVTTAYKVSKGIVWNNTGAVATPSATENTFLLDALGQWRNCDALSSIPGTKVTVLGYFKNHYNTTSGSYSGIQPSMLYFKPTGQTTLIKLYNNIINAPAGYDGFLSYQQTFAVGMTGTFLAISAKDGKFYAVKNTTTIPAPAAGKNYVGIDFNLQEVSEPELLALIEQMN